MLLRENLRVLTIGDGDLSFSNALLLHHRPKSICATVYDSPEVLKEKYGLANLKQLVQSNVQVICGFDVTMPDSWQGLERQSFDVVIFQFPLIPNDASQQGYTKAKMIGDANLRNRRLLHLYIKHAQQYFLDPNGQRLAIITSKDVKPYRQWDIERSLTIDSTMKYLGQSDFNCDDFPEYRIRNVDRDKFVKQTLGICYYYSDKAQPQLQSKLRVPDYLSPGDDYCAMCRVGPMLTEADIHAHRHSKRHVQMSEFERRWREYLTI